MSYKTKEQAGAELLAAIDAYVNAVMVEQREEEHHDKEEWLRKYAEEHRTKAFHIPDDAKGPYAQYLREELGIQ